MNENFSDYCHHVCATQYEWHIEFPDDVVDYLPSIELRTCQLHMLLGLSHEEERARKNTEKDIGMLFLQRYAFFHKCYKVECKLFCHI